MIITSIDKQSFGFMPATVQVYKAPEIVPAIIQRVSIPQRAKYAKTNYFIRHNKTTELPKSDYFAKQEALPEDFKIYLVTPRHPKSNIPFPKKRVISIIRHNNEAVKNRIKAQNKPIPDRRFSTDNLKQS